MKTSPFSLIAVLGNIVCAALVLLVRLAAPSGWLYDLRAGEGTGQGQRSSADVQQLQRLFQNVSASPGASEPKCRRFAFDRIKNSLK